MKENISNIQIDAVIIWVDGNDKQWQEKINKFSKVKIDFGKKKESVRYNSIGEIDIAIKSIIKYASFINNIFLVTDNQIPESFNKLQLLAKNKEVNLKIIDHKVIFRDFEEYLPCFNSRSIESVVFRIPNLSEHFILFNDDMFLMRETKSSDFFINGIPIIRGKWKQFYENSPFRVIYHKLRSSIGISVKIRPNGFKKIQQTSAKLAGANRYVRRFHIPANIRQSTLTSFFKENNLLKDNIKYRFRNENQFIIASLSEHIEINKNSYYYKRNTQLTYFRSYKSLFFIKLKLFCFLRQSKNIFMTFQSLELADEKTLNYIFNWIDKRIN